MLQRIVTIHRHTYNYPSLSIYWKDDGFRPSGNALARRLQTRHLSRRSVRNHSHRLISENARDSRRQWCVLKQHPCLVIILKRTASKHIDFSAWGKTHLPQRQWYLVLEWSGRAERPWRCGAASVSSIKTARMRPFKRPAALRLIATHGILIFRFVLQWIKLR